MTGWPGSSTAATPSASGARWTQRLGRVRAEAAPGQDAADRVRALRARQPQPHADKANPRPSTSWASRTAAARHRKGKFMVLRLTSAKRLRAKLHAVKDELRKRMHRPIAEQGQYLRAVVAGHAPLLRRALQRGAGAGLPLAGRPAVASHAVPPQPGQAPELEAHAQDRRSLAAPSPHLPPLPEPASDRHDPRQEPCAVAPHARICGGGAG
ncbi:MAG: hypothetical protein MZW92_55850 [Comamonadaceae bacterium]|nr:hypothetical protein [Comamonadaceae bacterium]